MKTALYRHYDADGALLYVGTTARHLTRLVEHMRVSGWSEEIATITIEHFPTREEARTAERMAIRTENPRHNVHHRACVIGAPKGSLLRDIEVAAHSLGITPSTLSRQVGQGGKFYDRIKAGRRVWPETATKVREKIADLTREHAAQSDGPQPAGKDGVA